MMKMYLTEMIYMLELTILPVTAIALSIIFTDDHYRARRRRNKKKYFLPPPFVNVILPLKTHEMCIAPP